jgi:adenylylsulfate kinase-like enzyme
MSQLTITIEGPAGSGKTLIGHFLCGALRVIGCKVELREEGKIVHDLMHDTTYQLNKMRPSVSIVTRQGT